MTNFENYAFSMVAERSTNMKSAAKNAVKAFEANDGEALAEAIAALAMFTADNQKPSVTVSDTEIVVVTYSRDEKVLGLLKGAAEQTAKGSFRAFLGKRVPGSDAWRWTASKQAIEKYATVQLWEAARGVAQAIQAAA
jgi:hypothetical protein